MRKTLLRFLWTAPLVLLFAGTAYAQTTGTIIGVVTDASSGKPVAGAVIIATSPQLQGEQTAVTDDKGNYRLALLPPGAYKLAVQLEGFKPAERADIQLRVDKTLRANIAVVPEAVQMEEQVVRTGTAPVVNIGSAESGAVVSQEFIASVPVARGYEGIAVVAPTAKTDFYGVSFAGAQSPENQYIIDGLNTTDPTFGTRSGTVNGPPALRTNFLQELEVKTGGFSAEYGRATGGIMNGVLKSGSNTFTGSVFTSFTPSFLVEPSGKETGAAGEAIGYRLKPDEGTYNIDFGFEVGGPILKDKLWFYAGFAPIVQKTYYERFLRRNVMGTDPGGCPEDYAAAGEVAGGGQCVALDTGDYLQTRIDGTDTVVDTGRTTYQWVGKLSYLLDENNTFTLNTIGSTAQRTNLNSGFFSGPMYASPSNREIDTDDGQIGVSGKWGGKFLSKRLIGELQAGWYGTYNTPQNRTIAGVNQDTTPALEWTTNRQITDFEPAAGCTTLAECPVFGYVTGGRGGNFDYSTNRFAAKASVAYLFDALGSHNAKAGIDLERVDYDISKRYTGGTYWRFRTLGGIPAIQSYRGYGELRDLTTGELLPGAEPGDPFGLSITEPSNKSETDSFAYFIQDSWTLGFLPDVTINAGLRLETQSMKNLDIADSTGFDINDNWSPRLEAIWDFTGDGRGKVAGSWGRFYYAMPLDMGDRAFGAETQLNYFITPTACPGLPDLTPATLGNGGAATFDPRNIGLQSCTAGGSPAVLDLDPFGLPDYFLTGGLTTPADPDLKGQYVDQFGAQVEYEVLADLSVGVVYQGRRQGYVIEDMSSNDGNTYFIGNPGRNRTFEDLTTADPNDTVSSAGVLTTDPQTGRNIAIAFPKPERSYDGVTFKATKLFSKSWLAQASYTYSVLRGNYPGPFRPEDNQLDPGITSEYDLASLMANKNGYLPGDQTHQLKLYGAYNFALGPRLNLTASGAYTGVSGAPVNALGAHPIYGTSQAFLIPRGMAGRTPFTHQVDLGGRLEYVIRAPFAVNFGVDIFNVFNSQEVLQYDEDYTFDDVAPIANIDCNGRNAAGSANPIAAIQADCPDLAYLKTVDGRPASINPNWGKPGRSATTAFQAPLSVRLSLALTF